MTTSLKKIFYGIVRHDTVHTGSLGESTIIVLRSANGQKLQLSFKGAAAGMNKDLSIFDGREVEVSGTLQNNLLLIDKPADIKPVVPPKPQICIFLPKP